MKKEKNKKTHKAPPLEGIEPDYGYEAYGGGDSDPEPDYPDYP